MHQVRPHAQYSSYRLTRNIYSYCCSLSSGFPQRCSKASFGPCVSKLYFVELYSRLSLFWIDWPRVQAILIVSPRHRFFFLAYRCGIILKAIKRLRHGVHMINGGVHCRGGGNHKIYRWQALEFDRSGRSYLEDWSWLDNIDEVRSVIYICLWLSPYVQGARKA